MSTELPAENPLHPDDLAQLPHGRHGLPPEFVDRNQRARLIAALTAIVGEVGYGGVTVTRIKEVAVVSPRTFYKFFDTVEECALAAFDDALEELRPLVAEAWEGEEGWPQKVRAVLEALLLDFAEFPDQARLLTAEPFVAGPELAARHKAMIEEMVPFLREGRRLREDPDALPKTTERGLLGSLDSVVARQVVAGQAEELPNLLPDLTQFVLTPYLGARAARAVASA